jgi:hypothetical protein
MEYRSDGLGKFLLRYAADAGFHIYIVAPKLDRHSGQLARPGIDDLNRMTAKTISDRPQ